MKRQAGWVWEACLGEYSIEGNENELALLYLEGRLKEDFCLRLSSPCDSIKVELSIAVSEEREKNQKRMFKYTILDDCSYIYKDIFCKLKMHNKTFVIKYNVEKEGEVSYFIDKTLISKIKDKKKNTMYAVIDVFNTITEGLIRGISNVDILREDLEDIINYYFKLERGNGNNYRF